MRRTTWAAACLVAALTAADVADATDRLYWQWTTDDGVTAFADEEKKIPKRYRARAFRRDANYSWVTLVRIEESERVDRLRARLDRLRGCSRAGR